MSAPRDEGSGIAAGSSQGCLDQTEPQAIGSTEGGAKRLSEGEDAGAIAATPSVENQNEAENQCHCTMSGKRCTNKASEDGPHPRRCKPCSVDSESEEQHCILCWCTCSGCASGYPNWSPEHAAPAPDGGASSDAQGSSAAHRGESAGLSPGGSEQPAGTVSNAGRSEPAAAVPRTQSGPTINPLNVEVIWNRRARHEETDAAERWLDCYDALASVMAVPTVGLGDHRPAATRSVPEAGSPLLPRSILRQTVKQAHAEARILNK